MDLEIFLNGLLLPYRRRVHSIRWCSCRRRHFGTRRPWLTQDIFLHVKRGEVWLIMMFFSRILHSDQMD